MRRDHAGLAAQEPVIDHGAAVREAVGEAQAGRPADGIEGEPDGRAGAGPGAHPVGEIIAIDDRDVGADAHEFLAQGIAPDHVDGAHAARVGEPNDVPAHGRVGGILNHPVSGPQIDIIPEHEKSRRRIGLEHGGVVDIEGVRDLDHQARLDAYALGPVAAPQAEDLVSRLEAADRTPDLGDAAGALDAYGRGQLGRPRIAALDDEQVGGVDGRGRDVDHHLVIGRNANVIDLDAVADCVRRSRGRWG